MERRNVVVYDLESMENISILRPENAVLLFSKSKTVDIGSLCFKKKEKLSKNRIYPRRNPKQGKFTDPESFLPQRVEIIRRIIDYIVSEYKLLNNRTETIRDYLSRFINFVFWADEIYEYDVLINNENLVKILNNYSLYLEDRYRNNQIGRVSIIRQQHAVINFIDDFFNTDCVKNGVRKIRKDNTIVYHTEPPNNGIVSKNIKLSEAIFDGLCDLVLNNKSYPYKLQLPEYLGIDSNSVWVLPAGIWFMLPERCSLKRKNCLGFNYSTGEINTEKEIEALSLTTVKNPKNIQFMAMRLLKSANDDFNHSQRKHIAHIAYKIFTVLFLSQTAMNLAQLFEIKWDENQKPSIERQKFRVIKWRANGRICNFELAIEFMPRFKKFIDLRNYLLGLNKSNLLFFTLNDRGAGQPKKINHSAITNIENILLKFDPSFKLLTSRQWRAKKSDWSIRENDISTTAELLQNNEDTLKKSYLNGTDFDHVNEMTKYLNSLSNIILIKNTEEKLLKSTVGKCFNYNNPKNIISEVESPYKSNCIDPEGCLFCDKYRLHVDEIDVRKLVSFKHFIGLTSCLIGDLDKQEAKVKPIINRIELLLCELKKINTALVEKIIKEVDQDGCLDNYWDYKLGLLIELGVL